MEKKITRDKYLFSICDRGLDSNCFHGAPNLLAGFGSCRFFLYTKINCGLREEYLTFSDCQTSDNNLWGLLNTSMIDVNVVSNSQENIFNRCNNDCKWIALLLFGSVVYGCWEQSSDVYQKLNIVNFKW